MHGCQLLRREDASNGLLSTLGSRCTKNISVIWICRPIHNSSQDLLPQYSTFFFFGNGRLSHSLTICSIPGANFISTAVLVVYHSTMCVLIYDGTSRYVPESWSMLLRLSCRDRLAVHWSAYRPSDARHCCSFTAVTLYTIISLPTGPVLAAAEILCPEVHVTHVWHASLCTYHPHRLRDHFQLANAASKTLQSCTSNTR